MYLQPYNYPRIQMARTHQNLCVASPSLLQQSHQLSRSQGNLPQLSPVRSPSPNQLQADSRERSRSFNILTEQPPAQPAARAPAYATNVTTTPAASKHTLPPMITVETDGDKERHGRSLTDDSEESFASDSSFSDDLSSSSAFSPITLSLSTNDEQLFHSRTPPPMMTNHLSPTSILQGKLIPSVSDPNLYKGPATPKVPPRPQAQQILTRCTTITRKNAAKGSLSPTKTEILR